MNHDTQKSADSRRGQASHSHVPSRPRQTYHRAGGSVSYAAGQNARAVAAPHRAGQAQRPVSSASSPAARVSQSASAAGVRPGAARPQRRKKRKKKLQTTIIATMLVLVVLATGVFTAYTIIENRIQGTETQAGTLPEDVKTLPDYEGSQVNFVVCGIDYNNEDASGYTNPDDKTGNTDMILYVNFNIAENKVNIMQIPRDTYVGNDVNTGGTGKINALYANSDDADNRMAALARVLKDQFQLPVDFYVTIDMDALKEIVDIKGWIEVYVPLDIIDPENNVQIDAGWQHLDAAHVEFLLRNRYSPTYNGQMDIARLRTQQSFYSALFREFKSLSPSDLLMWMNVLTYRCKTDMSLWDLGGIAQKALKLEGKDITFVRPACGPVGYTNPTSGVFHSVITLLPEEMATLLNEYFRPEGQQVPLSELNIQSLPIDPSMGVVETEIKTMADVQEQEAPKPSA